MPASRISGNAIPDISEPLARLIATARWVENGKLCNLDNNVQLAKAVGLELGRSVSPSYIQGLRQAPRTDPRWSTIAAICRVFSARTGVDISPDYFYGSGDAFERATEVENALHLARLRAQQELS